MPVSRAWVGFGPCLCSWCAIRLLGEQCEAGLPLLDTCESLGFDSGDLGCNAATCQYDTNDCEDSVCLPRRAFCSSDADCCSGDCRGRWIRRCR